MGLVQSDRPAEVLYLHAPSDGRPCHPVAGGGDEGMQVLRREGQVRIGFVDGPNPTDWNVVQFEWVDPDDLVAVGEACTYKCCTPKTRSGSAC